MRSLGQSAAPTARAGGGGTLMYCDSAPCDVITSSTLWVCSIPFSAATSYQRIYLSATIAGIEIQYSAEPAVNVEATITDVNTGSDAAIASCYLAPAQTSLTLTNIVDLAAGDYDFQIGLAPMTYGDEMVFGTAFLQLIVGQIVAEAHCPIAPPPIEI